jgi:hypothetical protein
MSKAGETKSSRNTKAEYSPHYLDDARGHIYIDKPGACTIDLTGAAAMTQEELNFYGKIMAKALSEINPKDLEKFSPR